MGPEDPTNLDVARARVLACDGVARGHLAAVLYGLDSVSLDARPTRRGVLLPERTVVMGGIHCADGFQTLVDLAATLIDNVWEQALESALRGGLTSVDELTAAVPELGRQRAQGTARIGRVLRLRPKGAAPTGSLLETLMVQLARTVPDLPPPTRQFPIRDASGRIVAYLDLAWPELGLFIGLDGQHHENQPQYDASRETTVVILTGWLCGRFTWRDVVWNPTSTARRLEALADRARGRLTPVS
ncbi:MAG TPA: hypothetical protein VM121_00445 [Acidimicrobiales bacterium]|nr:hypothetical protein [Acidimicrobiales bacterium]